MIENSLVAALTVATLSLITLTVWMSRRIDQLEHDLTHVRVRQDMTLAQAAYREVCADAEPSDGHITLEWIDR